MSVRSSLWKVGAVEVAASIRFSEMSFCNLKIHLEAQDCLENLLVNRFRSYLV